MNATSQSRPRGFGSRITPHASLFTVSLLLALATFNADAQNPLALEAGFVSDIDNSANVTFTLQFNRAPDFFTCDQYGRQADAFQFYIATSTNIPVFYPPRPYASLIRGGEINYGNGIVIRNDGPSDETDPHSGGWGSVRGSVPYTLSADTLMFSVPADVLDVQGPFAYSLLLTSFGAATHNPYAGDSGGPIPVPEPAPFSLVLAAAVTRLFFRK
jgi:hypothetical protein